jgi:hypothetical protein
MEITASMLIGLLATTKLLGGFAVALWMRLDAVRALESDRQPALAEANGEPQAV